MEEVEAPSCQNNEHSPIAKGKRTKRHRPLSPIAFTITSPTIGPDKSPARPNPNFSTTLSEDSTTTEEEDTAKSLILLARGHYPPNPNDGDHDFQFSKLDNSNKKRYTETAATTSKVSDGACMYACKTCNRAFASFQALGGHRASHTKPKNEKKMLIYDDENFPSPSKKSRMSLPHDSLSLQLNNISTTSSSSTVKPFPSPRMHECSYCGMEFTSGQALGGHMRRHRAGPNNPSPYPPAAYIVMGPDEPKKPVNGLSLDLNLPAPEDENKKIDLEKRQQQQQQQNEAANKCLVLSTTPTLVDCPF